MKGNKLCTQNELKEYFNKAILIQQHAFKESYAKHKFEQSCETLVSHGFCNTTRDCERCALAWWHKKTLEQIKDPEEAYRRYMAYNAKLWAQNRGVIKTNHGIIKTTDKKGRVIQVLHYNK